MSVSNSNASKSSSCKSDTSNSSTSKTNSSIAEVHMSVSNSNASKSSSCKSDTSKPSPCKAHTSKTSTSKTNATIAKVNMSSSTNQTYPWTSNNPRSIEQCGTTKGEKLSITVSFWPLISSNFLFNVCLDYLLLAHLLGQIFGMSVLVTVAILCQHLGVDPVEVG